jgi:glycosyl hydrolase family 26
VRRLLFIAALLALVLPASSGAAVRLGVAGDKSRFRSQTGQNTQIHLAFTTWGTGLGRPGFMDRLYTEHGPIPMLTLHTKNHDGKEAITPRGIARGVGDRYLVQISEAASRFAREAYIRPLAEMNGHWNYYSAYNSTGSYRGDSHSTRNFRRAFRRIYFIMKGGTRAEINARLSNIGLPPLRVYHDIPENPLVRVFWNPQGFGSPDLAKNSANSYYPGDQYVDVVGNDLYDQHFKAEWDANLALFRSHPSKPYAIGEWGLWGIDDPTFVRNMANFVKAHPRVEAIVYYKSLRGGLFDLGSKPKSLATYKRYIVPLG